MLGISTLNDLICRGITDPAEIINSREIIIDLLNKPGRWSSRMAWTYPLSDPKGWTTSNLANHSLLLVKVIMPEMV